MSAFTVAPDPVLCPIGKYRMFFRGVKIIQINDTYGKSESGKVDAGRWRFEANPKYANHTDENGVPYELVILTGLNYGFPSAGLTKLADSMEPGMTKEMFPVWDYDAKEGTEYIVKVKHEKNQKGEPKAVFEYIEAAPKGKTMTAGTSAPKLPDVEADPFVDGADEEEV